jgi:hypothetical protein
VRAHELDGVAARATQLALEWADPMQWADVPAVSRDQMHELFGVLLHPGRSLSAVASYEPPGSGKLSHPGSPILSEAGSPILSHPGAAILSHPAGRDWIFLVLPATGNPSTEHTSFGR